MHVYCCPSVVLVLVKLMNIEPLLRIPEFSVSHTNSNYNPNIDLRNLKLPKCCILYRWVFFKEFIAKFLNCRTPIFILRSGINNKTLAVQEFFLKVYTCIQYN